MTYDSRYTLLLVTLLLTLLLATFTLYVPHTLRLVTTVYVAGYYGGWATAGGCTRSAFVVPVDLFPGVPRSHRLGHGYAPL